MSQSDVLTINNRKSCVDKSQRMLPSVLRDSSNWGVDMNLKQRTGNMVLSGSIRPLGKLCKSGPVFSAQKSFEKRNPRGDEPETNRKREGGLIVDVQELDCGTSLARQSKCQY
jgi:hypothetical protein